MATALVGQGQVIQAQYRLAHRDASTSLRIHSHTLPAADARAAATIENKLTTPKVLPSAAAQPESLDDPRSVADT